MHDFNSENERVGIYMITKEELRNYIRQGLSTRKIADITGYSKSVIGYHMRNYGLSNESKFKKLDKFTFDKIDTKEKAYALGFILADSSIDERNNVEVSVAMADKEIAEFIARVINAKVHYDYTYNKKTRRFPRARLNKCISDVTRFTGGRKKADRHFPIIAKELEPYMLLGFFDGDGHITYGHRKDRGRLWASIGFTSQFKLLYGVQQYILRKINVSSQIFPKAGENCFVLRICSISNVIALLNAIYKDEDFVVLHRKHAKYKAVRLELEENGESDKVVNTVPSLQSEEGVETSGVSAMILNNRNSIQVA